MERPALRDYQNNSATTTRAVHGGAFPKARLVFLFDVPPCRRGASLLSLEPTVILVLQFGPRNSLLIHILGPFIPE